jgi:hypothetical protein
MKIKCVAVEQILFLKYVIKTNSLMPGSSVYGVEKVTGMDEDIRVCIDYFVHSRHEIIIDLLLAEVHAALRVEAVEGGETEVGVGDVDDLHLPFFWTCVGYKLVGDAG